MKNGNRLFRLIACALALTAQSEYRFPIFWRFRGAVFAAVGNVGGDAAELLQPADLKPAAGGGIRFKLLKDQEVSMRFDVAVSLEGVQVYFSFNEAF
jgi:outer membrane translocation and assembly module TamA